MGFAGWQLSMCLEETSPSPSYSDNMNVAVEEGEISINCVRPKDCNKLCPPQCKNANLCIDGMCFCCE